LPAKWQRGGHGASQVCSSEPPSVFSSENRVLGTQHKNPLRGTKLFALPYILQNILARRARTSTERAFLAGKSERVFVQNQELLSNSKCYQCTLQEHFIDNMIIYC